MTVSHLKYYQADEFKYWTYSPGLTRSKLWSIQLLTVEKYVRCNHLRFITDCFRTMPINPLLKHLQLLKKHNKNERIIKPNNIIRGVFH